MVCLFPGPPPPQGLWSDMLCIDVSFEASLRPCVSPSLKTSIHSFSPMRGSP